MKLKFRHLNFLWNTTLDMPHSSRQPWYIYWHRLSDTGCLKIRLLHSPNLLDCAKRLKENSSRCCRQNKHVCLVDNIYKCIILTLQIQTQISLTSISTDSKVSLHCFDNDSVPISLKVMTELRPSLLDMYFKYLNQIKKLLKGEIWYV